MADAPGYRSKDYIQALAQAGLGQPLALDGCDTRLLSRPIEGSDLLDLAGPYPFLCCSDWSATFSAFEAMPDGFVSFSSILDPFCPLSHDALSAQFDIVRKFNNQYIIDLRTPPNPSRHHARKLRRKRPGLSLRLVSPDAQTARNFARLYETLVDRKSITDFRAFDPDSLAQQAQMPGAWLVEAWIDETLVGADLYYIDGPHAYAHLSAYAEAGYQFSVSYPMMWFAISELAAHADYLNLGGAPAVGGDGIAAFKRGWTQMTAPSHLVGKVLDQDAYTALSGGPIDPDGFFPGYRA